jgi:hypothetical protein
MVYFFWPLSILRIWTLSNLFMSYLNVFSLDCPNHLCTFFCLKYICCLVYSAWTRATPRRSAWRGLWWTPAPAQWHVISPCLSNFYSKFFFPAVARLIHNQAINVTIFYYLPEIIWSDRPWLEFTTQCWTFKILHSLIQVLARFLTE